MTFGSVCSGIEAASVAWHPLGWRPAFFAEIEPFPSAVLEQRWPGVPNVGDFTRIAIDEPPPGAIDLLVGGTPCQDFSVAGKRAGLDAPRGNLTLEFLRLAQRLRPRWLVWENVPGVLSIDGGRTFGTFLGILGQLGFGYAYRILDAQHFGVPQRRRRVFVVGYLGDHRAPAAVLFELACLRGDPAPSREAGAGVAGALGAGASDGGGWRLGPDEVAAQQCVAGTVAANSGRNQIEQTYVAKTLNAKAQMAHREDVDTYVVHSLRAEGFDASEDGTGRGTPLVFDARQSDVCVYGDRSAPLDTDGCSQAVCFDETQITHPENRCNPQPGDPSHPLASAGRPPSIAGASVRRLTPRECERLQGFPDDYTLVKYRGKPAVDGPRYRALGNSMAVPVMRWIGERIALVDHLRGQAEGVAA